MPKKAINPDLQELMRLHAKLQRATDLADSLRPRRDFLIRKLVNQGAGIRTLAREIDTYPSTITRVCQRHPAIVPVNKPWAAITGVPSSRRS